MMESLLFTLATPITRPLMVMLKVDDALMTAPLVVKTSNVLPDAK